MKQRVELDITWSGQRRAYADTTTEGYITFENDWSGEWGPNVHTTESTAMDVLRSFLWYSLPGDDSDWAAPRLMDFKKAGDGRWSFFISRRYND